jgi:probable F420-dependent oxidoreductase
MKFGVMLGMGIGDGLAYPEYAAEASALAEQLEFESVWAGEHVVHPDYTSRYPYTSDGKLPQPPLTDVPDPLVWLSYVAGVTTRIRLATGVVVLPQRNPVILAKQVATLDVLSRGRTLLGVGVGWMREESDAIGAPFDQRAARMEEFIAAMRALWREDEPTYAGEHVRFTGARCHPKPVHERRVPIIVGGSGGAAARRAGRLGDGYYPIAPTVDRLAEQIAIMGSSARESGRDPDDIEITTMSFALVGEDPVTPAVLDSFRQMEELGVRRIVVPRLLDGSLSQVRASLERFAEQLIGAYV